MASCSSVYEIIVAPLSGFRHVHHHAAVGGDGLPVPGAVLEVAVTAGHMEPLDHAGLDVCLSVPVLVLVRLEAVVDDDLAGADRRRELGGGNEGADIAGERDAVAVVDALGF